MKFISRVYVFGLIVLCAAISVAGQNCPKIKTTGPSSDAKPGDIVTFVVNVTGGDSKNDPTYNWSVSAGTITSGQGTVVIKVDVATADSVTATVDVGGLRPECDRTSSYTVSVAKSDAYQAARVAAETRFNEGQTFFNAYKNAEAVTAFGDCIKLAPEVMACWAMRGLSYKALDKRDEAVADLTQAINLGPDQDLLYEGRGDVYFAKGMFREAVMDYSKLIKPGSTRSRDLLFRGLAYSGMKSWERAIADYTSCITIDPKAAGCFANRGAAKLALAKRDEAIADFKKALELDRNFWLAKSELEKLGIK